MKQHNSRGIAHILLIFVLVIVALSVLARCDISHARGDEVYPIWEHTNVSETNCCRVDNNLAGPDPLQYGV